MRDGGPAVCLVALVVAAATGCSGDRSPARSAPSVVGTWEATSQTMNGREVKVPWETTGGKQQGAVRVIYTAEGHYMTVRVPTGRPLEKPDAERTAQDWVAQYQGLAAQYGTYTVSGDRLTRRIVSAVRPQNEGTQVVLTFQVDAETLTTTQQPSNDQVLRTRYRRVK